MRWIGTFNPMQSLQDAVEHEVERTGFSGVVRLDRAGETEFCTAYGYADRARRVPNTVETLFATASGSKGLTALAVMSLVERGTLALGTTARSLLGTDLPLIADDVTVGHLLAHRSGIGDYLDEEAVDDISDYVMPVSVHELATTEQFLAVLDGHETAFPAGEEFAYNNGGYVVLALLAERASGVAFAELVRTLVCEPAGMVDTSFLRSDELPGRAALGYLSVDGLRTNVFHLPLLGNGDGGVYSTLPTSAPSGTHSSPDGSSHRNGSPRWCDRTATGRRRPGATASGSTSPRRATGSGSRGTTRASRSPACTSPRHRSPAPSSQTGQMVPGRSSDCSTPGSASEHTCPLMPRAE
jgi:CubicO group peptidase (beta-lactamase class C family)